MEGDRSDVGTQFLRLDEYARTQKGEYGVAEAKVWELSEATDQQAKLVVKEFGHSVVIHRENSGGGRD